MKFTRLSCLGLAMLLLLAVPGLGLAEQNPESGAQKPQGKAQATVTLDFFQLSFVLSSSGGQGELVFKGKKYPLKIGGAGIGGFGMSRARASGEVYNLRNLSDFAGTYLELRAGFAVVEGRGTLWLENDKGVILKLKSRTKGLALSLGADGMIVQFDRKKPTAKKEAVKK